MARPAYLLIIKPYHHVNLRHGFKMSIVTIDSVNVHVQTADNV